MSRGGEQTNRYKVALESQNDTLFGMEGKI
jgi:hypothetical protein